MSVRGECIDLHLHWGRSRDGARLSMGEIERAMERSGVSQSVIFPIDEPDPGPSYERMNERLLKTVTRGHRFIPFCRLNPRAGGKALRELVRCERTGCRGVKLHPRSEKFSPAESEALIDEIENLRLPVILHTSHEKNCSPRDWEKIFRRHKKIYFILAHAGKDAFREAIAVARLHRHVWLETSTQSYWRTSVILKELGPSRVVFGSDYPYSHPLVERLKLDLLLNASGRRRVYFENPKRILEGS